MCFQLLASAAPYIAGAGQVANLVNNQQAARAQDREVAAGMRRNQALTDQGNARVRELIDKTGASNPAAEEQTANADFLQALKSAKMQSGGDFFGGPGGARFADDLGLARTAAEGEGKSLAARTAAIDAPQFQRQREGVDVNNASTDLGLLGDQARGNDYLTQLRVSNQRPNPWVSGFGDLVSAFGRNYSTRAAPVKFRPVPITDEETADITRGMSPWRTAGFGGPSAGGR